MFLSEPSRTNYDINFTIFGFDVRVHPAFFVMPMILGASWLNGNNAGMNLIILIVVFFVSILIHELGHAFAFRYFGQPARIVLYWMGGLAIPDGGNSGPWSPRSYSSLSHKEKIIISAAGPIFGFILAALLVALVFAMGGGIEVRKNGLFPLLVPKFAHQVGEAVWTFMFLGIWANVFFNLLNLVPVYPLDGGQITRELFEMNDGFNGTRNSILLSVFVGAIVAVFSFATKNQFIGFFFGFMAWSNYMTLQQMGGGFGSGRNPW